MSEKKVFTEVSITPDEIVAADSAEFTIRLVIGPDYTAEASRIIFDFPGLVGTSRPTRQHQEEHGYVQAYVMNPDVGYDLKIWDLEGQAIVGKKGGAWRQQATRFAVLDLDAGLQEGDVVELHWGDTGRGFGPGTRFSHVVPRLDYYAVTDHQQPWDVERHKIGKKYWDRTTAAARESNRPGEFLAFVGIEYRCPRGDTAVVFNWLPEYEEIDQPDYSDVRKLWEGLQGKDYLAIPHFHNAGRLDDGEWWKCPDENVEPVLEIFSCHGSYEREDALEHHIPLMKARRPDRYADHMLKQGFRYGLVCNSDSHKGHVGSNGVTAAFATSLDADSIFDAYRKRHVYGTTNARIRLVFTANDALMGSVLENASEKTLIIDVTGDNDLKKVEIFRNAEFHKRLVPDGKAFRTELTVREDEPSSWYVRVTQKDNQIAWSSPIWFE